MANQFPTNNYNDSGANQGQARTGDPLYADQHYVDGDGFLYGLGMVKQRVLSKPANSGTVYDGLTDHSLKWSTKGSTAATLGLADDFLAYKNLTNYVEEPLYWNNTAHKIGFRYDGDTFGVSTGTLSNSLYLKSGWIAGLFKDDEGAINVESIVSAGDGPASINIGINTGRGLYIGQNQQTQTASTYNKLNINLYNQLDEDENDVNMSGLEFTDGSRTRDTAVAGGTGNELNQLRIMLDKWQTGSGDNIEYTNVSGLTIHAPANIGSGIYDIGGLSINFGTGLTLDNEGHLIVDTAAINITGAAPIVVTTSGNSKIVSLDYADPFYKDNNNKLGLKIGDGLGLDSHYALHINLADNSGLKFDNSSPYSKLQVNPTIAGNGLSISNGIINFTPGSGLELYDQNNKTRVKIPAVGTTKGLYFDSNEALDVKDASTSQVGVVKLSSAISSDSENMAATPKAVKDLGTQLRSEFEGLNTEFVVVSELPTGSDINKQNVYLKAQTHQGQSGSYYEEYVYVKTSPTSTTYRWEKIGDTDFELAILTATEVNAIVTDVFGF